MDAYPTALKIVDEGLRIEWSDGHVRLYGFGELREACPCATCREKRKAPPEPANFNILPVLSPEEARPLTVTGMKPVGHYAYSIAFSDGHDTGIYTFERLREIGREA